MLRRSWHSPEKRRGTTTQYISDIETPKNLLSASAPNLEDWAEAIAFEETVSDRAEAEFNRRREMLKDIGTGQGLIAEAHDVTSNRLLDDNQPRRFSAEIHPRNEMFYDLEDIVPETRGVDQGCSAASIDIDLETEKEVLSEMKLQPGPSTETDLRHEMLIDLETDVPSCSTAERLRELETEGGMLSEMQAQTGHPAEVDPEDRSNDEGLSPQTRGVTELRGSFERLPTGITPDDGHPFQKHDVVQSCGPLEEMPKDIVAGEELSPQTLCAAKSSHSVEDVHKDTVAKVELSSQRCGADQSSHAFKDEPKDIVADRVQTRGLFQSRVSFEGDVNHCSNGALLPRDSDIQENATELQNQSLSDACFDPVHLANANATAQEIAELRRQRDNLIGRVKTVEEYSQDFREQIGSCIARHVSPRSLENIITQPSETSASKPVGGPDGLEPRLSQIICDLETSISKMASEGLQNENDELKSECEQLREKIVGMSQHEKEARLRFEASLEESHKRRFASVAQVEGECRSQLEQLGPDASSVELTKQNADLKNECLNLRERLASISLIEEEIRKRLEEEAHWSLQLACQNGELEEKLILAQEAERESQLHVKETNLKVQLLEHECRSLQGLSQDSQCAVDEARGKAAEHYKQCEALEEQVQKLASRPPQEMEQVNRKCTICPDCTVRKQEQKEFEVNVEKRKKDFDVNEIEQRNMELQRQVVSLAEAELQARKQVESILEKNIRSMNRCNQLEEKLQLSGIAERRARQKLDSWQERNFKLQQDYRLLANRFNATAMTLAGNSRDDLPSMACQDESISRKRRRPKRRQTCQVVGIELEKLRRELRRECQELSESDHSPQGSRDMQLVCEHLKVKMARLVEQESDAWAAAEAEKSQSQLLQHECNILREEAVQVSGDGTLQSKSLRHECSKVREDVSETARSCCQASEPEVEESPAKMDFASASHAQAISSKCYRECDEKTTSSWQLHVSPELSARTVTETKLRGFALGMQEIQSENAHWRVQAQKAEQSEREALTLLEEVMQQNKTLIRECEDRRADISKEACISNNAEQSSRQRGYSYVDDALQKNSALIWQYEELKEQVAHATDVEGEFRSLILQLQAEVVDALSERNASERFAEERLHRCYDLEHECESLRQTAQVTMPMLHDIAIVEATSQCSHYEHECKHYERECERLQGRLEIIAEHAPTQANCVGVTSPLFQDMAYAEELLCSPKSESRGTPPFKSKDNAPLPQRHDVDLVDKSLPETRGVSQTLFDDATSAQTEDDLDQALWNCMERTLSRLEPRPRR